MTTLTPADETFAQALVTRLGPDVLREVEPRYLEEPRGLFQGQAGLLVAPRSVEEVSAILTLANEARVGVVPYGGGTGLVGGQVAPDGPAPLILSLERMRAIRASYPEENVLVAEAGATLAEVQGAAEAVDRLFPLSLASEGTARLGGVLSTNAGGVNVLRYGSARDLCLGVEAVLPTGEVIHGLKRLRKDNTGYDLRGLLVGAEGTLGVITAASLKLAPRPAARGTALFTVASPAAALTLLSMARDQLGEGVSAFELISGQGPRFLEETGLAARCPIQPIPDWSVLIEIGLGQGGAPEAALTALFEAGLERGLVCDGIIAQSEAQRSAIWAMREDIPQANRRVGAISSHDISLPLSEIAGFLDVAMARLAKEGPIRINAFGHLGDGNLHFNLFPPKGETRDAYATRRAELAQIVYDMVEARGGSFSAEHGIGRIKVPDLERYGDPGKLAAMGAIKAALDPNGIMNPGAMLAR